MTPREMAALAKELEAACLQAAGPDQVMAALALARLGGIAAGLGIRAEAAGEGNDG